jgi:hypothetical protein
MTKRNAYRPFALRAISLAAALACAAPSARAAKIDVPTDGYVYFHKAGATLATHDAAVDRCAQMAGSLAQPANVGFSRGAFGLLVGGLLEIPVNNQLFRANLENCMVAEGWDVVRVGDDEGRQIATLPRDNQASTLEKWVGSAELHGAVARTFQPLPTFWRPVSHPGSVLPHVPPTPLSLSEGVHRYRPEPTATSLHLIHIERATAVVPTDQAVIVIRMTSSKHSEQLGLLFGRLPDPIGKDPDVHGDFFEAASPATLFAGPIVQTTLVIPVQPGRWRLLGPQGINLCAGAPAFDVGPGEAVFAGSFDAGGDDPLAPDMSLAPAQGELKDAALSARLRPAHWVNGTRAPCGLSWNVLLYRYVMPGAPTVDGMSDFTLPATR